MDKELMLAFDFKKAPADLKSAGETHKTNAVRLEKAKAQHAKWTEELKAAQALYDESGKVFRQRINAWDPNNISGDGLIETPATPVKG